MNPQDAADHLLRKIMGGMIPQATEQQGMSMQAEYEQVALGSLYAFHDCLHLVALNKFSQQNYAFLPGGLLRTGLQVSVVLKSLLT
jgi:hypothetical protein